MAYSIAADNGVPRILWEQGAVHVDADVVLTSDLRAKRLRGARVADAEQWLRSFLASGDVLVSKIETAAAEAKFSWRTIERAKREIGARAIKPGLVWLWTLK